MILTEEADAGWAAGALAGVVGAVHRGCAAAGASHGGRAWVRLAVVGTTHQVTVNHRHGAHHQQKDQSRLHPGIGRNLD